jgi:hypothetical protein
LSGIAINSPLHAAKYKTELENSMTTTKKTSSCVINIRDKCRLSVTEEIAKAFPSESGDIKEYFDTLCFWVVPEFLEGNRDCIEWEYLPFGASPGHGLSIQFEIDDFILVGIEVNELDAGVASSNQLQINGHSSGGKP